MDRTSKLIIIAILASILFLQTAAIAASDGCIKKTTISRRISNSQCKTPCNAVVQSGSMIGGTQSDNCEYISICVNPSRMYDKPVFILDDKGGYRVPVDEELGNGAVGKFEDVAYQACYRVTSLTKKNGKIISKQSYDECRKLKEEQALLIGTSTLSREVCKSNYCIDRRVLDVDGTILRPKAWVCFAECGIA